MGPGTLFVLQYSCCFCGLVVAVPPVLATRANTAHELVHMRHVRQVVTRSCLMQHEAGDAFMVHGALLILQATAVPQKRHVSEQGVAGSVATYAHTLAYRQLSPRWT